MERYEQIIANAEYYQAIGQEAAFLEAEHARPWHLVTSIAASNSYMDVIGDQTVICRAQVTPNLYIAWWYKGIQNGLPAPDLVAVLDKLSLEMQRDLTVIIAGWVTAIDADRDKLLVRLAQLDACARALEVLYTL